jgi:adenylate kinase
MTTESACLPKVASIKVIVDGDGEVIVQIEDEEEEEEVSANPAAEVEAVVKVAMMEAMPTADEVGSTACILVNQVHPNMAAPKILKTAKSVWKPNRQLVSSSTPTPC